MGDDELLTVEQTAKLLKISEESVRRAFDRGDLSGERSRPGPGGWRRISRASAEAYRRAQLGQTDTAGEASDT